jgi:hypothetical protein
LVVGAVQKFGHLSEDPGGLEDSMSTKLVRVRTTHCVVVLAVTFVALSVPRVLTAQPGIDQCPEPDLPLADSASSAMWFGAPYVPFELDSAVWAIMRLSSYYHPSKRQAMRELVERYGGPMVAKAFLDIIDHAAPYFIWSEDRAHAAYFYGEMHHDYPEFLPLAPLPALLVQPHYDDELKAGLTRATRHFEELSHETDLALSTVLCQTAFHVRPFVHASQDIAGPGSPTELDWYSRARFLLRATVIALVARPGGMEIIERYLATETNPALAEAIRGWAANPPPLPLGY